jgi:hypothetical protein
MEITPRRRRAAATVLALVLAIESVSAVGAAAGVATAGRATPARPEPVAAREPVSVRVAPVDPVVRVARPASVTVRQAAADPDSPAGSRPDARATPPRRPTKASSAGAGHVRVPIHRPRVGAGSRRTSASGTAGGPASFAGRNHLWIPSLGINRSVSWFPCDRSRPPDNYVYRWGCAGANNVYLLGHAYSVFDPLHDAYVGGRLHKGMEAVYADSQGHVHRYTVRWWKVVRPTTSASWAWAAQPVPSMTLQTCVGRDSQYRLMVRLLEVAR